MERKEIPEIDKETRIKKYNVKKKAEKAKSHFEDDEIKVRKKADKHRKKSFDYDPEDEDEYYDY